MRVLLVVALLIGCTVRHKSASAPIGGTVAEPPPPELDESTSEPVGAEASGSAAATDVSSRELTGWSDAIVASASASVASGSSPTPSAASPVDSTGAKGPEKLVIQASIDMRADDVAATVDTIRARVTAGGGRMVSENVRSSGPSAWSADLQFRVPPAQAMSVVAWLGTVGRVTNRSVISSDVSKTLFDQELALANLNLTMERLQKLAAASGPIADLLTIEKEMTRVRGQIERIKGEHRWLLDRVDLATINVSILRAGNNIIEEEYEYPEARVYPGAQVAMLTLFDAGMRQRTRFGGGASIRLKRYATFDFSIFPRGDGGDSRAVLVTFGAALYSSYLDDGRRRFFNPYIGARIGYGYLSGDGKPVVAGELGIELFKHEYLLVDTSVRMLGYITDSAEAALHATLGASVPF